MADSGINKIVEHTIARAEELAQQYMAKAYLELKQAMLVIYEKYAQEGILTMAEMAKYNRMDEITAAVERIIRPALIKTEALLEAAKISGYAESFARNGFAVVKDVGVNLSFAVIPEEQILAAAASKGDLIGTPGALADRRAEILAGIKQDIGVSLTKGTDVFSLAKTLEQTMGSTASSYMNVARTETTRAATAAMQEVYAQSNDLGIVSRMEWIATLDDRTRPNHAKLDGQFADENGAWHVAGLTTYGPGKFEGYHPEEDCQCRCDVGIKVEGTGDGGRYAEGEVIGDTTFAEWAAAQGMTQNVYGQLYGF
jgi:SPP1 gp7 family putative phage head morphogenesis protein